MKALLRNLTHFIEFILLVFSEFIKSIVFLNNSNGIIKYHEGQLTLCEKLSTGYFGEVYKGILNYDQIAIKVIL